MKKIVNLCLLALSFPFFTSCDHGFDNLNKSKTGATSIDPAFVLPASFNTIWELSSKSFRRIRE